MNIENILKEKKGTIVDVRTPAEFSEGERFNKYPSSSDHSTFG